MIDINELRDRAATFGSNYLTDEEWVEVIDRLEAAEKECNVMRADKATLQRMAYSLKDHLEAAEQERDWHAERCEDAMNECAALRAKVEAMEKQEPVEWRTFDGEGGYDYRSYEDNENYKLEWDARNPNHIGWVAPLYTLPGAQPAPSVPSIEDELLRQSVLGLVNQYGDERAIEAYHGDLHCRKAPKDLFAEIERALETLSALKPEKE